MPHGHQPVLVEETLRFLEPQRGGVFVDCTVGLGGHSEALLDRFPEAEVVGIDRDPEARRRSRHRLRPYGDRVRVVGGNFADIRSLLGKLGVASVAGVLADLGVSSNQLESAERGFSFRRDGPLDMRMDPDSKVTAREIVNSYSEGELQKILRDFGEERFARRVARRLVQHRKESPLETTGELRDVVHRALGQDRSRRGGGRSIDSATRTFQALRIEVNQELSGLEQFLDQAIQMLEGEGRLVVISYHSLEDRIVKLTLRGAALGENDPVTGRPRTETRLIELLTKKPVRPSEGEVEFNPRARSARLRAARRL